MEHKVQSQAARTAAAQPVRRCKVRLTKPVVVAGCPEAKCNDILDMEESEGRTLVNLGCAVALDDEAREPAPQSSNKRIRLTRPVVVKGMPGVRVGDELTLPTSEANQLIHEGSAEEVEATGLQKLAKAIGF